MQRLLFPALAAIALALAACGGGGSGSPGPGGNPMPATPTPCPSGYTGSPPNCASPPPTTTQASGLLVNDETGAPLSGIPVGLAPWVAGATPQPEGTTAPDGTFAFSAPNGHYLLVIGSNATSDTTWATVHDNVTLTGGAQTLKAPVLPPWPTVTPPPWETNGTYRIGQIDQATELPCLQDYDAARAQHGLGAVVEDEWVKENVRDVVAFHTSGFYGQPGYTQTSASHGLIKSPAEALGGTTCNDVLSSTFVGSVSDPTAFGWYTLSPHNLWFAGRYDPLSMTQAHNVSAFGVAEFPVDPRYASDPSGFPWP